MNTLDHYPWPFTLLLGIFVGAYSIFMLHVTIGFLLIFTEKVRNTCKEHYFRCQKLILFGGFYIALVRYLQHFEPRLMPYYMLAFLAIVVSIYLPMAIYKDYS